MKFTSTFEIKGWDVASEGGAEEIADMSRVTIRKAFDGELKGTSVGYGVMLQTPEQTGGYVVIERVNAVTEDGREGTFVIQHYGVRDAAGGGPWYGDVVPGSGTDGFAGVSGTFAIKHEEGIAEFGWDFEFAEPTVS
jgi:hypothetical protein